MADNVFVEGVGGKLVRKSKDKNTYKLRKLNNGEENLVLKNYFTPDELILIFKQYDKTFSKKNIFYGKCFWQATYCLNNCLNHADITPVLLQITPKPRRHSGLSRISLVTAVSDPGRTRSSLTRMTENKYKVG